MKTILVSAVAAAVILLSSCETQPDAYFFTDKIEAEIGEEIFFFNGSHNASEFEWDFGDGTWSDAFEPAHSYSASGIFTVILSAYSESGYVDRAFLDIEISSPTMLEVEVLEWYEEYPVARRQRDTLPHRTTGIRKQTPSLKASPTPPGK